MSNQVQPDINEIVNSLSTQLATALRDLAVSSATLKATNEELESVRAEQEPSQE